MILNVGITSKTNVVIIKVKKTTAERNSFHVAITDVIWRAQNVQRHNIYGHKQPLKHTHTLLKPSAKCVGGQKLLGNTNTIRIYSCRRNLLKVLLQSLFASLYFKMALF